MSHNILEKKYEIIKLKSAKRRIDSKLTFDYSTSRLKILLTVFCGRDRR